MSGSRLDARFVGWSMCAFYGGRAEARIVRVPVPVVVLDANSMYPLVNANLDTSQLLAASELVVEERTEEVRRILASPALLDDCLDKAFWREAIGVTLVELELCDGNILPARAAYDPTAPDPGIGINPFWYEGTLWYALPDVIASVLLTGRPPRVRRAYRLVARGQASTLRQVRLRGGRIVDPRTEDPFVAMIEERHWLLRSELPEEERERIAHSLKITASATSYGTLARFDRRELADEVEVTVYGPDDSPLARRVKAPEDPGPRSMPPVAASITAAARLMLAVLERLVSDAGGAYAFCDTDSMAIVALPERGDVECPTPDGAGVLAALSYDEVKAIARRFDQLNPLDRTLITGVWKVEHGSLDRQLWCYAISAKRYALYRIEEEIDVVQLGEEDTTAAEPELEDWSEHGLGLYHDPMSPRAGRPARTADGKPTWIGEAWQYILRRALGYPAPMPDWARRPALTRFTNSSPSIGAWFAGRDRDLEWHRRIRPGSFGLLAQPADLAGPARRLPAAPYESDPDRWETLDWYDRQTGDPIRVTTVTASSDPVAFARALESGAAPIRTLGDVLDSYTRRPEHKSLAPDGSHVGPETRGLLQRRPVLSSPGLTSPAGKEGNRLLERMTGVVLEPSEYRTDFGTRTDPWIDLVVPALRRMGFAEATRRTSPAWRRSLGDYVAGRARPHAERKARLTHVASQWASEVISASGTPTAPDQYARIAQALRLLKDCECACGCGRRVSGRQSWASEACRKRAARLRRKGVVGLTISDGSGPE